jgi:ABC-2 type transport system ATP-binding protein
MSDQAMLCMRGVNKKYPGRTVLGGLDLTVPAGSVVGLLGKNGAGKTTLIKCALGLIRPQAGEITLLGEPVWELSAEAKARLGYVPQTAQLYPWMKIDQLIRYTASFYARWNHDLSSRLIREWELDPYQRIQTLSVGQLQKLAIILAIGHEPDLLILDEPAASLDPAARREFLATVLDLAGSGRRTVIFSTHITSDVERVADRVAILRNGRIEYHGDLDTLKDEVKRLRVTAQRPLPTQWNVPGLLRQRAGQEEALLSVRGVTPALIEQIETQWQARVEVQDLNLEDIFLEMHDGSAVS